MGGSLLFAFGIYYFRPDTRFVILLSLHLANFIIYYLFASLCDDFVDLLTLRSLLSISTWALEEAKKRLEARGDSARYIPSSEAKVAPNK